MNYSLESSESSRPSTAEDFSSLLGQETPRLALGLFPYSGTVSPASQKQSGWPWVCVGAGNGFTKGPQPAVLKGDDSSLMSLALGSQNRCLRLTGRKWVKRLHF